MFIRTAISTVLYLMANIFLGICFLLIKNPTCQKQRGRLDITTGCSRASKLSSPGKRHILVVVIIVLHDSLT
jgi:hypothetical protein